jgi:hypothetical protein
MTCGKDGAAPRNRLVTLAARARPSANTLFSNEGRRRLGRGQIQMPHGREEEAGAGGVPHNVGSVVGSTRLPELKTEIKHYDLWKTIA